MSTEQVPPSSPAPPPPLPAVMLAYASPAASSQGGVWRADKTIIASKGAVMPNRCVKCNALVEPALAVRKRYQWSNPLFILLILVGILGIIAYVIIAMSIGKKGEVTFFLCERHRQRRRIALPLAWVLSLLGIAMMIVGAIDMNGWVTVAGLVTLVGGIVAAILARSLWPKKIDDYYLWLKSACPAFLAELPGIVPPG